MMATWFYPLWVCYSSLINFEAFGLWARDKLRLPYNSPELKILFDGACPLCIRSMTLIACLDWLKRIEFLDLRSWEEISKPYPSLNREDCIGEMYVIDRHSQTYKGLLAYRRLAGVIPILWIVLPFLYLPGVSLVGDPFYRWISNRIARSAVPCTIHNCK